MKKKEDNEKLFHEASMESVLDDIVKNSIKIPDLDNTDEITKIDNKDKLLSEIEKRINDGESQWDVLSKMISGGFTERFMRAMNAMPDKDFVRNYLKVIEHFKPKLTRSEGVREDKPDTTINIQVLVLNEKGEKVIKKINNND